MTTADAATSAIAIAIFDGFALRANCQASA